VDYKTSETYYIFASDSAAFRRFETALNHVVSDKSE